MVYQDKYVLGIQYHPFKPLMAVEIVAYKTEHRALHLIDVDQTIARGGEPVSLLVIEDPYSTVTGLGFSPSGRYLLTSCGGTCIRLTDLLDLPEVGSLIEPESSHLYDTSAISYDASESLLLTKTASKGEAQLRMPDTNENYIIPAVGKAIALNADGTRAATVTADGIAVWDVNAVRAGDLMPLAVYPITGLAPTQLTFDAEDRLIALEPSGVTIYEPPASRGQ